jgi:hypothetical protein
MGGKAKAPKPPDYTAVAAASEKAAEFSFNLGKEQLAWAQRQYASDREILDKVVGAALARQDVNDQAALRDRQRYERIYQPLEDEAVREARDFASEDRQEYEMGRAASQVGQQFEQARTAALQNLESYGVDPSSTRFAALDLGTRVQQAAAQAGAANMARGQTENIGRALRSEAINVGRGYPGQVAGTYATALQSGNAGANAQLAGTASGANTMGTATQWNQQGVGALGTWGNTLNMSHQNAIDTFNANQQASSGLGGLLGAGLGIASNMGFAFERGGAVPEVSPKAGPGVTPGGNVPPQASPSAGRAIDDVDARLTAGEFVMPVDVVKWKGEEFFQRLIEQSRKSKPEAPAQPQPMTVPAQRQPTFQSRPSALPMG